MSKKFRPLFPTPTGSSQNDGNRKEKEPDFEETLNHILEEKSRLEEQLKDISGELEALRREKEELLGRIRDMEDDLKSREEQINKLKETLQNVKVEESLTKELCSKLTLDIQSLREQLLSDTVEISKKVLMEFLVTDILPREELITKVLEGIFEETIRLKGDIKIFVNPVHIDTVFNLIGELKAKTDSELEIEVVGDESLNIGEVRVESPRFVIERLNDEAIEEIFREVLKSALEGS